MSRRSTPNISFRFNPRINEDEDEEYEDIKFQDPLTKEASIYGHDEDHHKRGRDRNKKMIEEIIKEETKDDSCIDGGDKGKENLFQFNTSTNDTQVKSRSSSSSSTRSSRSSTPIGNKVGVETSGLYFH